MRYEDASHTGAFQGQGPVANDDTDQLAAGSKSTATGNLISGEGTQSGSTGADIATGGHITAIAGKGGEDSSFASGKLSVVGEYGKLSVDAEGNYVYQANKGVENVRDRFTYTLADNNGASDTASLVVEIGKTPMAIKADAQQIVVGPDGVVTLPAGVELSDVHVVGRNLVVDMPDGTQLIILDGAVFVPQLVLGGVEVPSTNVAALLIGQEVAPAAGENVPSSGGNFAVPPPPLDPGVPLGDLIPPTEYNYVPPEPQEVLDDVVDEEPEIFIEPDGQPRSVSAIDSVDEKGLPARNEGEPEGSGEEAAPGDDGDPSEATGGTIIIDSPDGIDSLTITGADGIPREIFVGLEVDGAYGTLTITGLVNGNYTYSYVLNDNIDHSDGDPDFDNFGVTLTDPDGDQASATLVIDIIDDVPTARPDTDQLGVGDYSPVTGNVITDDDAGDQVPAGQHDGDADNGHDTVGADDAHVTAVSSVNVPGNTDQDPGANFLIDGQYGVLTLNTDGSYSYVRNEDSPGGVTEVFNYTITDGDGDTSSTTLTITIPDTPIAIQFGGGVGLDDDVIPGAGGNPGGPDDDAPDVVGENVVNGNVNVSGGDGGLTLTLRTTGAPDGFEYVAGPNGSLLIQQDGNTVVTVTLDPVTGDYTVTQNAPINHPSQDNTADDNTENNVVFPITVRATDIQGDFAETTGQIIVDDDTPVALEEPIGGTVDEDGAEDGIPGGVNDVPGADNTDTGNVGDIFSAGADQPLTFNLLSDTSGLPQDLTSGGVAVTYSVVGNTLTASAGAIPVFTFVLNPTTGDYTFTLLQQLDHPTENGDPGDDTENLVDIQIELGSIVQATDADGDSVTALSDSLVITVDDDTPTAEDFEVSQSSEDADVTINITGHIAGGADGVDLADVTSSNLSGDGDLSYNPATGVFTYEPAPGEEGDVTFDYTIVDGDGDEITKTVTIHLADDSEPQPTAEAAFLDDDGLDAGNPASTANDINANSGEDTNPDEAIWSGTFNATFGNDTPGSFSFGADLDGDSATVGQEQVTYTVSPNGLLLTAVISNSPDAGRVGDTLFTVQITNASTGAYTVTLETNVLHITENGAPGDDTENLTADDASVVIPFTATDSEGDPATANLTIKFDDDAPTASDIETNQVGEDANVEVDITGSFVAGADGVDLADVTSSNLSGDGNLSYNPATGVFTYEPAAGETGDVTFNYTIVDADGDKVTKEVTIHLGADSTPIPTAEVAKVDDDGLDGGNAASTANDIDANAGEDTNPDEAIWSGTFNANFGNDTPGSFSFGADLDGDSATVGQEQVTYTISPNGLLLTAVISNSPDAGRVGDTLFTVQITNASTGAYTVTLETNVLHITENGAPGDDTENLTADDASVVIPFTATDSEGDPATANLTITFDDDAPTLSNVQPGDDVTVDETAGFPVSNTSDTAAITFTAAYGADGAAGDPVYGLTINGAPSSGLTTTVGGFAVTLVQVDANTIQGQYNGSNVAFTIDIGTDGKVTLTQNVALNHGEDGGPAPTDHNDALDLAGHINATVTITDTDGDKVTQSAAIGDNLIFLDDGPDAAVNADIAKPTLVLDESPAGQDPDGDNSPAGLNSVTAGFASNFLAADHGSDGPGTVSYALDLAVEGSNSGLYALDATDFESVNDGIGQGDQIKLFTNPDGSISGRLTALGSEYFHISVNSTTGVITFTQSINVWHGSTASDDDTSTLTAVANTLELVQTVTDGDGDFDTASIDLSTGVFMIEDDGPKFTDTPEAAVAENGNTDPVVADLNLNIGTDGFGLLAFDSSYDGDAALDQDGNPLTLGGDALFYQVNGNVLTAETAEGAIGFTITLNQNGTYTFDVNGDISNGTSAGIETFSGIKAGNTDAFLVGAGNDDTPFDIIFTAEDAGGGALTVNNSQGRIATGNQGIDAGETVRIDLVENLTAAAVGPGNAFGVAYDNHVTGVTHYEQTILQVIGGANPVVDINFQVAASDDDTVLPIPAEAGDEPLININQVTVRDAESGNEYRFTEAGQVFINDVLTAGTPLANATGFTVNFTGTGAFVTGIESADVVELDADAEFNTVFVTSSAGNAGNEKFDLGGIFIGQETPQTPIIQEFDIIAQDRDGDQETATISTTINPPAEEGFAATSFSTMEARTAGGEDYSNLSFSNDNGKLGGFGNGNGNAFGNVGTTGIVSGMVAASGLSVMATSPMPHFADLQSDMAVRDTFQSVSTQLGGSDGLVESLSAKSFGVETMQLVNDPVSLQTSGHSFTTSQTGGHSLDVAAAIHSAPVNVPNMVADHGPAASFVAASVAPTVAMVSAEALQAANLSVHGEHASSAAGQIVAEVLAQGKAPAVVDAMLDAIHGGNGGDAALVTLASHAGTNVPAWDMAMSGAFGPGSDMMMKMGAELLHHDAVQPVQNG